jgi:urease accessory protein
LTQPGPILRARTRIDPASAEDRPVRDILLLDHEARLSPRGIKRGLHGRDVELALPAGVVLRHDDLLLLDDGDAVQVVARPERLIEVRAADLAALARAAWLVGDHHIPAELGARRLRVRHTEGAVALLSPLRLRLIEIETPFDPEPGAYAHEAGTALGHSTG